MQFWYTLLEHLWSARTPFLIAGYLVTRYLAVRAPGLERYHLRAARTLIALHVLATTIAAIQVAVGYDPKIAEISAVAFAVLAALSLSITAALRLLLPRVGIALPRIMIDLITGVGVIVAFIIVGRRAGFSVAGLITTSAVLTAVIGFSLQDTLGNVMGGLSVQLDKSIAVGDWISLGEGQQAGQVVEMSWRHTSIQTRNWDTIIVPNSALVKSQVTVLGRRIGQPVQTRRSIEFFVDFRTPPTDVIEAVERALVADPVSRMAREPAPHVLFHAVRESFARYVVRYWLDDLSADDRADSDVRVRVWYALRRAGIAMSIPASSVFLTHETAARAEKKSEAELGERRAVIASVDLFGGLPDELQAVLARELRFTPFAAGEAVTREGDTDDGLYIIVAGEAVVRIGGGPDDAPGAREVARLGPGQFFGEMSLMTGEARTATVVAATDLTCYRVDKPAFQHLLRETPSVADQIAEVLVSRRTALTAVRDGDDVKRQRIEVEKQNLLGKIRGFFGIDRS